MWRIDFENGDSRATSASAALQTRTVPAKAPSPPLSPEMKKCSQFPGDRIEAGDVWPLGAIAVKTGEGKIVGVGWTAMLTGYNVVDFKRNGREVLRETAVFTTKRCSLHDQRDQRLVH